MRTNFKACILAAVALLAVLPVACANEVVVGNSCVATCEEKFPDGLRIMNNLKTSCGCETCSDACQQSVCADRETPSDACLPCLQEGLTNRCSKHEGFFKAGCLTDEECTSLLACIEACKP